MKFLVQETNSLELKMALINALGWNYNGQKNAKRFLTYVVKKKIGSGITDLMNSGRSDLLLCYAYLLALDDYFQVMCKLTNINTKAVCECQRAHH
jgi:hypothetical protein